MTSSQTPSIRFYGSSLFALLPLAVFLTTTIYLFIFAKAFDMTGLAMGGFLGLTAGAFLAKDWRLYWEGAIAGIATPLTGVLVCILILAGIFSDMMKAGGIAQGFIYLGLTLEINGALFCAFTFVATAIIATATGTSIGTIFATVPVFFAAGVQLGSDPALLAGAILSGAIFGDNLAPVSDVTVISASTQTYRCSGQSAQIGEVVLTRLPYALLAGALTLPCYLLFGGETSSVVASGEQGDITALIMLLPVLLLVIVAALTKNIFKALVIGILVGCLLGIVSGRFAMTQILSISESGISGFLYAGISNMAGTIMLCLSLFAIIGVLEQSGILAVVTQRLLQSSSQLTGRKAESLLAIGALTSATLLAGVTSAALIMFGPIADKIGHESDLHPLRRSHIISSMANSLPVIFPFSAFVFIMLIAVQGLPGAQAVTPFTLLYSAIYPLALFLVFTGSIITGIGRCYESTSVATSNESTQGELTHVG